MDIIKLKGVSKFYNNKGSISLGFSKVNLSFTSPSFTVITGESGSGKSTLLNVISGLDTYEEGEMYINGSETSHFSQEDYEEYRRKYICNIFQDFNLIGSYTVYQNVELSLILAGFKKKNIKARVLDAIEKVGLTRLKNTKASNLSGGEKQRTSIARALALSSPIIVADEPTGNIDRKSAREIMHLLHELSKTRLVIVVTHNTEDIKGYADRIITMSDGKVVEDKKINNTKEKETNVLNYKNISLFNKIRLGIRNTFNIKYKFVLLVFIYLILTLACFFSYSSIRKNESNLKNEKVNMMLKDTSKKRIIISKKDKSEITDDDIKKLESIKHVNYVNKNDMFIDGVFDIDREEDNIYFYSKYKSNKELKKVDVGDLPKSSNDAVIKISNAEYKSMKKNINKYLNVPYKIYLENDPDSNNTYNINVTGFIISKDSNNYMFDDARDIVYLSDNILSFFRKSYYLNNSNKYITINNKTYSSDDIFYLIKPLESIESGKAIVSEELNSYCDKEECTNKNISLKIENAYFTEEKVFNVKNVYNSSNFKKLTGLAKELYDEASSNNTIFINENDYNELYDKGTFQASVFVDNVKSVKIIDKELESLNYNTINVKDTLTKNYTAYNVKSLTVIKILYVISIIILFFVCYAVIKIILNSRKKYFSIIRILGATKGVCKDLLNIELLVDVNISYLIIIVLIMLTKGNIINIDYLDTLIKYLKLKDYIILYIVLILMSLLISMRYSRKIFKYSPLETERREDL